MDKLQFILPIRNVTEWAAPVKEIYSVEEALAFLDNYPKGRESTVYQRAVEFARQAIVEAAREAGILVVGVFPG
jgi:hypothetical protein